MKIETYEKAYLWLGGLTLLACLLVLLYSSFAMDIHLPGRVGEVDPKALQSTPPFDQPGIRQVGPNRYQVVLIGRAWSFDPQEIRVPVGAEVTFVATSQDVIHGFFIEGTRVNIMLIPGQIATATHTFREPGEYTLICHEYCGIGHHTMFGKVIAE